MSKWSIDDIRWKLGSIIDSQYDKYNYCYARYKNDISVDLQTNSEVNYYTAFSGFDYKQDSDLYKSAYFNVIKSVIDSIVSKLANQKVRPFFTPVNGTYKTRRIVKQCQQFFDNYYEVQSVHSKITKAFAEACIFGLGYLYVNPITYNIEVLPSWTVATLNTESVFESESKMLVRFNNYPTTLLDVYDIKLNSDEDYVSLEQLIDTKSHKYIIYVNGAVVKEFDYKPDILPLVTLRWNQNILGNYSSSIVEELDGIQTQIDLISAKISAAAQLTPANTTYVLEGSNLSPGDINNRVGNVYGVKCPPGMSTIPVMNVTPSPIDPYWQSLMEYYVQKAYEIIGISQLSAMSQKPKGADSGVALQTLEDVESDRFETQVINFVSAFKNLAKVIISVVPENEPILPTDNFVKSFRWKDVVKQADLFKVQYSAQSALSKDPQEKLKQVLALREQGFLSNYEVPIYLDLPDLQTAYEGAQAIENAVDALIDDCIENGTIDVPEFIDYEQLAQRIVIVENQFAASYTGQKKEDAEVDSALTNLRALEDNLMSIMEANGFIANESTQELGDDKNAANITKSLSGGKDISQTIQPSETLNEEPVNGSLANDVDVGGM